MEIAAHGADSRSNHERLESESAGLERGTGTLSGSDAMPMQLGAGARLSGVPAAAAASADDASLSSEALPATAQFTAEELDDEFSQKVWACRAGGAFASAAAWRVEGVVGGKMRACLFCTSRYVYYEGARHLHRRGLLQSRVRPQRGVVFSGLYSQYHALGVLFCVRADGIFSSVLERR